MSLAITVTIITYNEEAKLAACLRSVHWADEVIVLDSGSTDSTVAIARRLGATVVFHEWLGFARQKNLAATHARNNWVLNLDADERADDALAAAATAVVANTPHASYAIERRSDFMGIAHRPVHRPKVERLVRLYDRQRAGFADSLVHEKVSPFEAQTATSSTLPGLILHEGYRGIGDFTARINKYSGLLAAERPGAPSGRRLVLRPLSRLLWDLFYQRNILDGRRGIILSFMWAFHDLLVEVKRLEAADPAYTKSPFTDPARGATDVPASRTGGSNENR